LAEHFLRVKERRLWKFYLQIRLW